MKSRLTGFGNDVADGGSSCVMGHMVVSLHNRLSSASVIRGIVWSSTADDSMRLIISRICGREGEVAPTVSLVCKPTRAPTESNQQCLVDAGIP